MNNNTRVQIQTVRKPNRTTKLVSSSTTKKKQEGKGGKEAGLTGISKSYTHKVQTVKWMSKVVQEHEKSYDPL